MPDQKKFNLRAPSWLDEGLIIAFFLILTLSLLAPLASNDYIPIMPDYKNHIAAILQAKMALLEGQFPLRTAPFEYGGLGYAYFQFYSPSIYTLAGMIYQWITPNSPFMAYKICMAIALIWGGFYIYRSSLWLVKSKTIAVLTGVAYLLAPYTITAINIRGAFTEVIALGITPVILYYSLRLFFNNFSLFKFITLAFAWYLLATTHLITFIYTSLFLNLFFIILTCFGAKKYWKNLVWLETAYFFSCLLAIWFLAPVVLTDTLIIRDSIHSTNPAQWNWLTPISELLSFSAVSPIPWPSDNQLLFPVYTTLGWPMLLAVFANLYGLLKRKSQSSTNRQIVISLLVLFFILLFGVWSPFDAASAFNIWSWVPKFLWVGQFTFRLMTQIIWVGALLFAYGLFQLFSKKMTAAQLMIGILLLLMASQSWLRTSESTNEPIVNIIQQPHLGLATNSYLVSTKSPHLNVIPIDLSSKCSRQHQQVFCDVNITDSTKWVQLPILYYPQLLRIIVNGKVVDYFPSLNVKSRINLLATLKVPEGKQQIVAEFIGCHWANQISLLAWIILLTGFMVLIARRIIRINKK